MVKSILIQMKLTILIMVLVGVSSFAYDGKKGDRITLTDSKIVIKISALPIVELSSDWEKDIIGHSFEIMELLKARGINIRSTFQYVVMFNHPSSITKQGEYYIYIVSLFKKKVLRLEGDDLWLIEKGKKDFSDEQRKNITDLLQ